MPLSEPPGSPLLDRLPDEIIARSGGVEVHVDEFLTAASALAIQLPDRAYVINLSSNRHEFLLGYCAAVIAGQCTLMPPNRQPQTLLQVAGGYGDCYVLGGERIAGLDHTPIAVSSSLAQHGASPVIADDQLCSIVFTSGSAGESKPNRKTWKTLRLGSASNAELLLGRQDQTLNVLATVPPQHMWGFEMSILLPLFSRTAVSSTTPFFPGDILDGLRQLPHPRALVSSPIHLAAFLEANVGEVAVDYIFSATAPMSAELARQLESRLGARVMDVFGCSESGIIAARHLAATDDWQLAKAFRLRRSEDQVLICADHLDMDVPLNDRVEILDDSRFRWIGRDEDMVNIAGKRGSLADINRRLNALPGVSDCVVFAPATDARRLAALVVAPSLQASDILAGLRNSIEPAFLPRPIYIVPALPRQETGKLSRQAVLDLYTELKAQRRAAHDDDQSTPGE